MVKKLLVIEDDPELREILSDFLPEYGFYVLGRGSGHEALSEIQNHSWDAILVDLALPDISGELVIEVASATTGRELPVVYMTACVDRYRQLRELQYPVLLKPFDLDDLIEALLRVCGSRYSLENRASGASSNSSAP